MATITKKDLVDAIAQSSGLPRTSVKPIAQALFDRIVHELGKGNRLELRDFGVFEVRTREPRKARNPKTGVSVEVPQRAGVRFKPGRLMKEVVQDIKVNSKE